MKHSRARRPLDPRTSYSLLNRESEDVLACCAEQGIAFSRRERLDCSGLRDGSDGTRTRDLRREGSEISGGQKGYGA